MKADKLFMRTIQQIMFLILNSVPVTFVTDWAHKAFYSCYDAFFGPGSEGQKGEGKKVHGLDCWKYRNIQANVHRNVCHGDKFS